MTDTNPRDLIQRMAKELDFYWQLRNNCTSTHPLADEARAYLSQPEPEGLTDEELLCIAAEAIDGYGNCGIKPGEYEEVTEQVVEAYGSELIAYARAVLARWGNHPGSPDSSLQPITPPPELVRHWSRFQGDTHPEALWFRIANEAAQWGADQELEATLAEVSFLAYRALANRVRAARRPKPPSLKEQALAALNEADQGLNESEWRQRSNTIRRALEALPDD